MSNIPEWTEENVNKILYRNLAISFSRGDWLRIMLETVFDYLVVSDKIKIKCNTTGLEIEISEYMPTKYAEVFLYLLKEFLKDRELLLEQLPEKHREENRILIIVNDYFYDFENLNVEDLVK